MQAELVQVERAGNQRGMIFWQDRIVRARAAKLLAVRQVTSTNGRHTPGVDGVLWASPAQKMQAVEALGTRDYQPQPARRVLIPKGDGRQRPLGILTMLDRAMQALYLLALDPIAESRADPHSYGFRKHRSTADAVMACAEIFAEKSGPQWVLEADIEECFDSISHDWLLRHIPLPKPILRGWLQAGYVAKHQRHRTTKGLPQGGIISPTLANMALDGMEGMLTTYFHHSPECKDRSKIAFVRYADDFIVAGADKRMLERDVRSLLANFLQERGMKFSARKTRITPLTEGFDFLGCHLVAETSLFGGYRLRITPAAKGVHKLLDAVRKAIQARPTASPGELVQAVNPIVRGWAGHYTAFDSQATFAEIDQAVWKFFWQWMRRRHPYTLKGRLLKQYCVRGTRPPVFTGEDGQTVLRLQDLPRTTHVPLTPECHAYDPAWVAYLARREQEK